MKTLYLECKMGAAGDMLTAALYELLPDQEGFLKTMNSLIPGVEVGLAAAQCLIVHGYAIVCLRSWVFTRNLSMPIKLASTATVNLRSGRRRPLAVRRSKTSYPRPNAIELVKRFAIKPTKLSKRREQRTTVSAPA